MRRLGSIGARWSLIFTVAPPSDKRFAAQYQMTSEINQGINGPIGARKNSNPKGKLVATRWMTKSTKEFMMEGDIAANANNPTATQGTHDEGPVAAPTPAAATSSSTAESPGRLKKVFLDYQSFCKEIEDEFLLERKRLETFDKRRWRKNVEFFKRQGVAFVVFYVCMYVGCFLALYLSFATGYVNKMNAFDCFNILLQGCLDRDAFFEQVEAWDTYINLGFAFVLNEMLEAWRFPCAVILYFSVRKKIIQKIYKGNARPTMFRQFAPH